jgi:hypothetical protein
MGLFWAGQGADLIRWPAESFMVDARQWIYYGGRRNRACPDPAGAPIIASPFHPIFCLSAVRLLLALSGHPKAPN